MGQMGGGARMRWIPVRGSVVTVVLAVLGAVETGSAQESAREPLPLPRLAGEIEVDGDLSDGAWQEIPPVEMTVHTPRFGAPPTERTVVRIAYSEEAIYVGAWMYDSEPEAIRVHSVARDVDNGGDFFNLVIDAFNDNQNAAVFATTPSGNRLDVQLRNDVEGPSPGTPSWNAFWDVEVSRDNRGWFAEMRVPFSSLRFQEVDGRVVMGLSVNRLIGRNNERHVFPAIPPNWTLAPFKPSKARDVSFRGIRSERPLFVTPFGATRHSTSAELSTDGSRYEHPGELEWDIGGDLKYAVTNNLNLDLTVNTDFAEVEVDDERVNLTRFSLFFPERRQFFLEREGTFDFGVAGLDRPFHSRRIGLDDAGRTVPIVAGGRLTGRAAGFDIGLLDMQTASTGGQPSENAGVLRMRRALGDRNSYVGLIATSRLGGGEHNVLVGADLELNLRQNDYLTAEIVRTFDSRPDSASGVLPESRSAIRFERRNQRGLGFRLGADLTGAAYRPQLGFVQRTGVWSGSGSLTYGFLTDAAGLRQISPSITGSIIGANGRRDVETWDAGGGFELEFRSGAVLSADVTTTHEDLASGFPLQDGVGVPAGRYRFTRARLDLAAAQGWSAGAGFTATAGGFFDGRIASLESRPFWNVSPYFRLTATYRLDRVVFDSRSEHFTTHVARIRPELSLSTRFSSTATFQYNSAADVATANLRLRYNFAEGNDLWVVYGHVANTETAAATPGAPDLPRTQDTALTVKYTYTFVE